MATQPSTKDRFEECLNNSTFESASTITGLAETLGIDPEGLDKTMTFLTDLDDETEVAPDGFERSYRRGFDSPFYATALEPAIFQTQGGLAVNERGKVLTEDRETIPNLFAGGGAATGVSGRSASGYLSGNGLLSALNLGRITGKTAAEEVVSES
jgi:fumarate reductase flavoprotein subunit